MKRAGSLHFWTMKTYENTMKTFQKAMKAREKNKVYHSELYQYSDVFMFSLKALQALTLLRFERFRCMIVPVNFRHKKSP